MDTYYYNVDKNWKDNRKDIMCFSELNKKNSVCIDLVESTMLPCNVTLRELANGDVEMAIVDPYTEMGAV